ncbi:MAG: hypothetical protein WC119_00480 [Synergistaceae bacterium]|jgi:hypothetical protein
MKSSKFARIMKDMENKNHKVVRVSKTEFELDTGDIYPIPFDLGYEPTLEEFQKFINDSKSLISEFIKKSEKEKRNARKR